MRPARGAGEGLALYPRQERLAALVAVRKLGKRETERPLEMMG